MTGRSLALGLVGHPVHHSLSPRLQHACAASLGIPLRYDLFDVPPASLGRWFEGPARALDGFNVTAPHKADVARRVEALGPEAARLGAVNTVVREAGRWVGHNTDLFGFVQLLGGAPRGPALVLGAGGAARAAVAGLADQGFEVQVTARTPDRAERLLARLGVPGAVVALAGVEAALSRCVVVVDAIGPPGAAWVVALPWARLPAEGRVLCLAYGDGARPVVEAVRAAGRGAADGRAMLAWQGIEALRHWTGRRADAQVALAAVGLDEDRRAPTAREV
ncbi:MAG: shikimate dehydrogenase [bacterium]